MTKADIAETVYEKVGGFSKKEAADIVETVFETVKATLVRGDKIKIMRFGNFIVRDKKARPGRNPQTGEEITDHSSFEAVFWALENPGDRVGATLIASAQRAGGAFAQVMGS